MLFHETSDTLITGGMDARLQFHKITDEDIQSQSIKAHWFSINDLVEMEQGKTIATASRDKSIRIWDPIQQTLLKDLTSGFPGLQKHSVNSLVWSNEHNVLFSAGDDKKIFAWQIIN
jgi:WD40 repeat protein